LDCVVFGRFSAVGVHAELLYGGVRELREMVELNGIEPSTS
jgi:hypothetical protein